MTQFTYTDIHIGASLKKMIRRKGLSNVAVGKQMGIADFSVTRTYRTPLVIPKRLRAFSNILGADCCELYLADQTRAYLAKCREAIDPATGELKQSYLKEQPAVLDELVARASPEEVHRLRMENAQFKERLEVLEGGENASLAQALAAAEAAQQEVERLKTELQEAQTQVRILEGQIKIVMDMKEKDG